MFIDYQNVYHRARETFGLDNEPPSMGHIRPARLGHLVTVLGRSADPGRQLTDVRLYRGEPVTGKAHPLLQAAFQRQIRAWTLEPQLKVHTRPLRYDVLSRDGHGKPNSWGKAREKGIDVLLAVDLVLGAQRNDYDVAVIVSGDTDLIPAMEATLALGKRVENAVWWPDEGSGRPLRVSYRGRSTWTHQLTRTHFTSLMDPIDYGREMGPPGHL